MGKKGDNKLLQRVTADELRDCYYKEGLSMLDIAKRYFVGESTVRAAFKIHNIDTKLRTNKLLGMITPEELKDCSDKEFLSTTDIAARYSVDIATVRKALKICSIEVKPHNSNKLLKMITPEELYNLFYREFMTLRDVAKKYNIRYGTIIRAVKMCNIKLDKEAWSGYSSPKQRNLWLSGIRLTDRQNQILVGSLLGDGSLSKDGRSYYSLTQCAAHKEYLEFMHQELYPFSLKIKEYDTIFKSSYIKSLGTINKVYSFDTIAYPELFEYRKLWYPNGKKMVPSNIEDLLTELGLAIWFMDDGSNARNYRYSELCTQGFSDSDVELLIDVLYRKFDIKAYLKHTRSAKGVLQPIIAIGARGGYDVYHSIVDPFIKQFTCFSHKLKDSKMRPQQYKLTEDIVRDIRAKCMLPEFSVTQYAKAIGVSTQNIYYVIRGCIWKHVV